MPTDVSEQWRNDLIRSYCLVAMACPSGTPSAAVPIRELIRVLVATLRYSAHAKGGGGRSAWV